MAECIDLTCSICHDSIVVEKTGKTQLSCGHSYHLKCIVSWFSVGATTNTCPMCRAPAKEMETPVVYKEISYLTEILTLIDELNYIQPTNNPNNRISFTPTPEAMIHNDDALYE